MWTCGRRAAQRQLLTLAAIRMSEAVSAGLGPTLVSPPVDLRPAIGFVPVMDLRLHHPDTDLIRAERGAEKQQVLEHIEMLEQRMKQLESRK
jgi:hypothetical protein